MSKEITNVRSGPVVMAMELPGQKLVIDGTNLTLLHGRAGAELRYVLALGRYLDEHKIGFDCYFDANTRYILQDHKPEQLRAFDQITSDAAQATRFHIVPSGTPADHWILIKAKSDGTGVVSNDKFRDRARKNPWIWKRRHTVMLVDGCLSLPSLGLQLTVLPRAEDYLTYLELHRLD